MGRHRRTPPLDCAAMHAILAAPEDHPATTDTLIAEVGRRPFPALRVCRVLARLQLSGWITTEKDYVHRPAYYPGWYEPRIGPAQPAPQQGRGDLAA